MKRIFLALALAALLLAGCGSTPQPLPTTEPPVTENVWEPFTGAVRLYEYYHETGEARLWEEDIIHMSEVYLDDYTQLTPFPSRIQFPDGDVEYDAQRYSPELREYYLARINALIPMLEGMDGQDILFYLQETVAACHDAHLEVYITGEYQLFPLYLQAEDDLGNHYGHEIRFGDNGSASMGGFGSFGQEHLWSGYIWNLSLEVPEEAQWVRFTYALRPDADFELVLELKEGVE